MDDGRHDAAREAADRDPLRAEPGSCGPERPIATLPADIQARVDRLKPWFHTVDCGGGITIPRDPVHGGPSDYPRAVWEKLRPFLPDDLTGLSVLDVGCNSGFFALQSKREGAGRVLGIEAVPTHLEQAKLVRELTGSDIELRLMSVYDVSEALGPFDITLCLGVVYHLKHPLLGLERLAAVTRGLLVVESAIVPDLPPESGYGGVVRPMAFIQSPPCGPEVEPLLNWFIPSPSCLKAWLAAVGFGTVVRESSDGRRVMMSARR